MPIIAAVQFASLDTVEANLHLVEDYLIKALEEGAKCVVFPEEFITLKMEPAKKLALAEPFGQGPIQAKMKALAEKYRLWIIAGTMPIESEDKHRYYSSCLVWDDAGQCVGRYDKIHLFDVEVNGNEAYLESAQVKGGESCLVLPTPFGKMGIAICYDVRFPELFRYFMLKGVDIIVLPSAFTQPTGKVHWETLLKARAIENLCYIIAPNQVGVRISGHGTYGHSMIINPWGEILAKRDEGEGLIAADIDLEKMDNIREKFPARKHFKSFIMQHLAQETLKSK